MLNAFHREFNRQYTNRDSVNSSTPKLDILAAECNRLDRHDAEFSVNMACNSLYLLSTVHIRQKIHAWNFKAGQEWERQDQRQ